MRENEKLRGFTCKNCGAPATMEICPYCGQRTGLTSEQANMEYPSIECKEASINVVVASASILSFMVCMLFGVCFAISLSQSLKWCGFIFLTAAAVALIIFIKPFIYLIIVKLFGKRIQATVYGYVTDTNGAQAVKLLCKTSEGPVFVIYQLGIAEQLYEVNSQVGLKVIGKVFLIDKPQTIDWSEVSKNGQ